MTTGLSGLVRRRWSGSDLNDPSAKTTKESDVSLRRVPGPPTRTGCLLCWLALDQCSYLPGGHLGSGPAGTLFSGRDRSLHLGGPRGHVCSDRDLHLESGPSPGTGRTVGAPPPWSWSQWDNPRDPCATVDSGRHWSFETTFLCGTGWAVTVPDPEWPETRSPSRGRRTTAGSRKCINTCSRGFVSRSIFRDVVGPDVETLGRPGPLFRPGWGNLDRSAQ